MKRWKVIIADDEPIIREGIREAVDWEALGLRVVAEAEDGEEAYELAVEHQAEIVLVDLNMPLMDGFTLMSKLRERFDRIRFIVITGYDEFEYVRASLRLGVDDYILKPANPDQLQRVLKKTRLQLEDDEARAEYFRLASKQIDKNISLLRERFCLDWIDDNVPETELEEQLRFLRLPPRVPEHLGILRWPDLSDHHSVWSENDRQLLSFAIENIVNETLAENPRVLFRTPAGVLVFMMWDKIAANWAANTERTIANLLKISVRIHVVRVAEAIEKRSAGPTDNSDNEQRGVVARAYARCKAELYGETQLSPLVRRARQYIRAHYTDPNLTLEQMATELNVSAVYLSRMIRQELDMSYIQLLTQTRLEKAAQLLHASDLTIADIAEQVGYESQHYFSAVFKKGTGVSPNQYRRQQYGNK